MKMPRPGSDYRRDDETSIATFSVRPQLLQRVPSTVGRVAALNDIHSKLAGATETYVNHGDGGRTGVYQAIMDVIEYFASQGIPRASLEVLGAVGAAIVDAERGIESPIFKPERGRRGGAPPTPTMHLAFDGHMAAVMECCARHLKAEGHWPYIKPASELAAKLINDSHWGAEVTPTQVREIRERVQQSARGAPERIMFDQIMDSELAKSRPLDWAKILLTHDWVNPPPKLSA